jgi:hypothetical protein
MNAFAEEHEHWTPYVGQDGSPLLLIAVALLVIAILAVLVILFRRRSGNTTSQPATPLPPGQTPDAQPPMPPPSPTEQEPEIEDPATFYNYEERILAMLKEKGCPMPQVEIAQTMNLPEQNVAKSLAWLEQNKQVRRTWDANRSTYMVEAVPDGTR